MNKHALLALAVTCALAASATADSDRPHMQPQSAQQLISRVLDTRLENVTLGSILYGSIHKEDGFEYRDACRVTAIVAVYEKGLMTRRVRNLNFLWSAEMGWFHQEVVNQRGRDELRIWSELGGDFEIK